MKLDPKIRRISAAILGGGYVCDRCLGRQFAKFMKSKDNSENGRKIRALLRADYSEGKIKADPSNFVSGPGGRAKQVECLRCTLCENVLERLGELSDKPVSELTKMTFGSFMIGVRMSDSLIMNEEALWERTGIKYCEPLKAEISRELAELVSRRTKVKPDHDKPDVIITFDVGKWTVEIFLNPIFVYGEYKKFSRGLPQTSSPGYRQTVQDIIARPLMRATGGGSHILHAQGREDKEARCLVWRPFVLEIKRPKRRKLDLKKIRSEINRSAKVKVSKLRLSGRKEIAAIKSETPFKLYRVLVEFENPVESADAIGKLAGSIRQRTPWRLLGQKPDKTKHKKIKSIKWKRINKKRYQIVISAESGLYLHELVTGDGGRTKPSVSELLGNQAKIKEFDLVGLED
jgi:tRNA pseudouridine synthase 10